MAKNRDLLRAFTAISRALNLGQPLPFTLDLIAEKVSQTMGHKYCAILLLDDSSDRLLINGSFGLSDEYLHRVNTDLAQRSTGDGPMSRSVTAQAFRARMPVYVHDITADSRFGPWCGIAEQAGYRSIVALPLIFRGEAIGVLNCYDEPRGYSEEEVDALEVVAEQAASAVGMARLNLDQRDTITSLHTLNRHAVSQHDLLKRSEEIHEALTKLLLEDRALDDITAALCDILGVPAVLQDERLSILSESRPNDKRCPGLPVASLKGSWLSSVLLDLRKTGRARKIEHEEIETEAVLATHVDLGGYGHGYLSIPRYDDERDALHLRTLEQASTIYALYMIKNRVAQEAEIKVRGDLLSGLLLGRFTDETDAAERARYLGLELSSYPYRLLVVSFESLENYLERIDQPHRSPAYARSRILSLCQAYAIRSSSSVTTTVDNCAALLMQLTEGSSPIEAARSLHKTIVGEFQNLQARVGVSDVVNKPSELAERYRETRALLELAERLDSPDPAICYDDWRVYGMLVRNGDHGDLLDLARRTLAPLLSTDKSGQAIPTLQCYLDNGLSPTRTAEALYVHPNTIKYRLKQIRKTLSLDPTNLDDILNVKVALMVRSLDPDNFDSNPNLPTTLAK